MNQRLEYTDLDFESLSSEFLGFVPEMYLEDAEALGKMAAGDAHELHQLESEGDWEAYLDRAETMRTKGRGRLERLRRGRTRLNDGVEAAHRLQAHFLARGRGANGETGRGIADDLRRLNEASEVPVVSEETLEELEAGKLDDLQGRLDLPSHEIVVDAPDLLRGQRNLALWYVAAGYLNQMRVASYMVTEGVEPTEYRPATRDRLEEELERIRSGAIDWLRRLHSALAGARWDQLDAVAARASSFPLEVRPDLYAIASALREGRIYESEVDENPGQAADFASAEVDLHGTLRLLALLLATAHRLRFVARAGGIDERPEELAEDAAGKGFDSLVRDGVNAEIETLLDDPGDYDGRLVEVEGYADRVRYDQEQAVTRFDIVDRLHDRRIPVYYPYHDLTDWHLRSGAYVRLHAEFEADSDRVEGPELQIDEVNVGEHSDQSWFDAIASDLAEWEILELYPSHGNVLWSHEPIRGGGHADHEHEEGAR